MKSVALIGAVSALLASATSGRPRKKFRKQEPVEVADSVGSPSRQVVRQYQREVAKQLHQPNKYGTVVSKAKHEARREKQRARLERQSEREKSGFYDKTMSVAMALDGRGAGRLQRGRFH